MEIKITKYTDTDLMRRCAAHTINADASSSLSLADIYKCEHSPMRTQMFLIEMFDIPTFVSVHYVRHGKFIEHFVKSNRIDRGGDGKEDRYTPINHAMWGNAQALVAMAGKRLCLKASHETRMLMNKIKQEMQKVDPDLAARLVKQCDYRGGYCQELKGCGLHG